MADRPVRQKKTVDEEGEYIAKCLWSGWSGVLALAAFWAVSLWVYLSSGDYEIIIILLLMTITPTMYILFFSILVLWVGGGADLKPVLKSQVAAIKSAYALVLGAFAFLSLLDKSKLETDILLPLLFFSFCLSFPYFYVNHLLHKLDEVKK